MQAPKEKRIQVLMLLHCNRLKIKGMYYELQNADKKNCVHLSLHCVYAARLCEQYGLYFTEEKTIQLLGICELE